MIDGYIIYNHWANKKLTNWLKTLDAEIIYRASLASFSSIALTLQHMKNAQNFWYSVITGQYIEKPAEPIRQNAFGAVVDELLKGSQQMIDTYTAFSDQELITAVTSPVMTKSRYDFILHVINHNSYHRGQIVTIARLSGTTSNIPETDYEAYLWFKQQIS